MTTWKAYLKEAFNKTGDNFHQIITTMTDEEINREFCSGFGDIEGCSFTAWGEKYVYFPLSYDGSESVGWTPRNPCEIKCKHLGEAGGFEWPEKIVSGEDF